MRLFAPCAAGILLIFSASPLFAHSYSHSDIRIGHVWALPSKGDEAEIFMPLFNEGQEPDRLTGAATARAGHVRFRDDNGANVDGFDLLPGRPLAMRPGKRAVVLSDLAAPLERGQRFEMILEFHRSGAVKVTVWVEDAPAD